jgi:hypothetical protein
VALSLQQIARALNGQIRNDQVLAPGPGHAMGDQSLSVKINDTGDDVIVYTFSPADDVMACKRYVRERCGIQFRPNGGRSSEDIAKLLHDVVAFERREPRAKPVAVYDYTDADGKLLYQVCRYEPKRFGHRQPDGHGGWLYKGLDRRVIYRWCGLLEFPSATVFVCEGEKDADNVRGLGLCATTVASGKWTDDCIQALAGRDCWILEDNDEAGRKKALEAATRLHPVAASVKIVRFPSLPNGGDVSDWLDMGRTKDDLEDFCCSTPDWQPEASSSSTLKSESPPSANTERIHPTILGHRRQHDRPIHDWADPDWSLLDTQRGSLPDFPLEILSLQLQQVIERTSRGAGVTYAHVAVPLLGISSGLIGYSRRIKATASWVQPATCWTASSAIPAPAKHRVTT